MTLTKIPINNVRTIVNEGNSIFIKTKLADYFTNNSMEIVDKNLIGVFTEANSVEEYSIKPNKI